MFWVTLFTVLVYVLANAPLLYSLACVHKVSGIRALWGYAPQQFLFLTVFFPFATLFTFIALRVLIIELSPALPDTYPFLWFFRHWPVSFLMGAIVASCIGITVYFSSAWSLDKLEPRYAQRALTCIAAIEDQVKGSSLKEAEQQEFRDRLIHNARKDFSALDPPQKYDTKQVDDWLSQLSPEVFLQVVQNQDLQIRLRLVNPTILGLNVLQFFLAIVVALGAVIVALICIYSAWELGYDGKNLPELGRAIDAIFYSVFLFGFYPLCYGQYRSQVTSVVGPGTTVLQDVFTAVLVVAVLTWLKTLDPSRHGLSVGALLRFAPVALVGSGSILSAANPQLLRQLIGSDTKVGIQMLIFLFVAFMSSVPIVNLFKHR